MLLNTEINLIKNIASVLLIGFGGVTLSYAQTIQCEQHNINQHKSKSSLYCEELKTLRDELNEKYLTAYLVTDAPIRLVRDTQQLWSTRTQQCKNIDCFKQQFDIRLEDLNFYTSMNQSLTQHFIKYENGIIAHQPVHLQVHQLSKDRIKIEGIAYRSPNNRKDTQILSLLAYTSPEKKDEILDNEHDCKYQMIFQKSILTIKTKQKSCERFTGIYRLYD